MPKPLDRSYDGIIIGAGQHGLVLGSYLAKAGLKILLVDRRLTYGGGLCTREVTKPGFYHNLHSINHFQHQRHAVVQGPESRRQGHLHHAALRIRAGASRRHRAGARPRPRGDRRQHRALLAEGRRDLPRLEPQRRGDHRANPDPGALSPSRCRRRSARRCCRAPPIGPRLPRGDTPPAARCGRGAVRERAREAAVPVQGLAVRHLAHRHAVEDEPDGLGDPRLRPADRLPALPGRLVQSGARADGDLHRRRRHLTSRRSRSTRIVVEGGRATGIALADGRTVRARAIRGEHASTCTRRFETHDRPRAIAGGLPQASSTISSTPPGRCSGCISRCTRARALRPRRSIPMSIAR